MSNEAEREACNRIVEERFGYRPNQLCMLLGRDIEWAFQAGAEWQRSQHSAPAGWQWVPVEMTEDMYLAFCEARGVRGSTYKTAYKAALAAAPKAECTNSDSWNCKYCNKTKDCEALKDPRNFASPKAVQPPVQCPAYSERIVPASTALIQWAWEEEPESTLFDEGYNAARRWVKMQLEYAVSKAPQPSDEAKDALEKRLDSARQLLICISATQPEWEPQISEWMMGSKGDE